MHEGKNMGIMTTLKKPTLESLRPPGGAQGRHRRRCALPVRLLPLPPPSPHGDSADRVDSCGAVWCTVPRS